MMKEATRASMKWITKVGDNGKKEYCAVNKACMRENSKKRLKPTVMNNTLLTLENQIHHHK